MNYTFHPHAERELEEIENHYDGILHELGNRFREDVEMTISRILKFPNGWQPMSEVFRRCQLNSFPYLNTIDMLFKAAWVWAVFSFLISLYETRKNGSR